MLTRSWPSSATCQRPPGCNGTRRSWQVPPHALGLTRGYTLATLATSIKTSITSAIPALSAVDSSFRHEFTMETTRRPERTRANLRSLRARLMECARYPERVLFLDVETTGLDSDHDEITVIGWSFGGCTRSIVRGTNEDLLRNDFQEAKALVTFNGDRFDTKFVARAFPGITFPKVHIDLLQLCRRVGLTGGQKTIEKALGIDLRDDTTRVDGHQAVELWHRHVHGDRKALRTLVLYNRVDVAAMGAILDEVVRRISARTGLSMCGVRFRDWSAPVGWRTPDKGFGLCTHHVEHHRPP